MCVTDSSLCLLEAMVHACDVDVFERAPHRSPPHSDTHGPTHAHTYIVKLCASCLYDCVVLPASCMQMVHPPSEEEFRNPRTHVLHDLDPFIT